MERTTTTTETVDIPESEMVPVEPPITDAPPVVVIVPDSAPPEPSTTLTSLEVRISAWQTEMNLKVDSIAIGLTELVQAISEASKQKTSSPTTPEVESPVPIEESPVAPEAPPEAAPVKKRRRLAQYF